MIRHRPANPLRAARERLTGLLNERKLWMEPHPFGPRYEAHIFAARREAHLAQLEPLIAEARAEVKRLKAES